MSTLVSLDFEDGELTRECQSEQDTQQKFATFFKKLPPGKWSIRDTSSSGFFNEPTAKIDFSIMDGQTVAWMQTKKPTKSKNKKTKEEIGFCSFFFLARKNRTVEAEDSIIFIAQ